MIEEPYRWVEAIQNRREYIEHQLAPGGPIIAVSCPEGIVLLTISRERQKIFEIYDRIAMGGLGHPGDLERLRMSAIDVSSAEGFTRSAMDVSLRRLVSYSMSPLLKTAFEQIYGPPYLARMLFVELGRTPECDLFVSVDYDGSFHTNGGPKQAVPFGAVSGTPRGMTAMEALLKSRDLSRASAEEAREVAIDAWVAGQLAQDESPSEPPTRRELDAARESLVGDGGVEAAFLDRSARSNAVYRMMAGA